MKKILLLCLALLLVQGVCFAKIEKGSDKFDGGYWYYVDYISNDYTISGYLTSSFIIFFTNSNIFDGNAFQISFGDKGTYFIDSTIKMQIDDIVYTWQTSSNSSRSNGTVNRSFPIPNNVYDALMKTQKNIAVRFFYKDISGNYRKDYVIPFKTIKDVQNMYKTYYKIDTTSSNQAKPEGQQVAK